MKQIAIFTSKFATVEELTAAYALALYLGSMKGTKVDRRSGEVFQTMDAFVVQSDQDELDAQAKVISDAFSGAVLKRVEDCDGKEPEIKIGVGIRRFSELGEQKGKLWSNWMDSTTYFVRPGKAYTKKRFGGILQTSASPRRETCTELIYDYIADVDPKAMRYLFLAQLLYLGLYWSTKGFAFPCMNADRASMLQHLYETGGNWSGMERILRRLDNPMALDASKYGALLSECEETSHTLLATTSIPDSDTGLMMMEHLIRDFEKDAIILYGALEDSQDEGMVYLYVRQDGTEGESRATDALRQLLVLNRGRVTQASKDGSLAYTTVTLDPTSVRAILKEKIVNSFSMGNHSVLHR